MTEIKKLTKVDYLKEIVNIAEGLERQDLIDFAKHEIELLTKKSTSRKPTATQKQNEDLKTIIVEFLKENPNELYTITQIQEKIPALDGASNQKVSALVRQLLKDNAVKRIEDKKRALFQAI